MMLIIEVLEKPTNENNFLYRLQVNDCGVERETSCTEDGYQYLLAKTEIHSFLKSKNCSDKEIENIFERVSTLQALAFADGTSEGINVGYSEATIDPDRG